MFREFLNNFILTPWRLDVGPNLADLWRSGLFWSIAAVLLAGFLIYRSVRKK